MNILSCHRCCIRGARREAKMVAHVSVMEHRDLFGGHMRVLLPPGFVDVRCAPPSPPPLPFPLLSPVCRCWARSPLIIRSPPRSPHFRSDIREIPDNQECFVHQASDQSIMFDLLEYQQEPDMDALKCVFCVSRRLVCRLTCVYALASISQRSRVHASNLFSPTQRI